MRNSQRQDSQLSTSPPSTGPRIGPSAAGMLMLAIVRVLDLGSTCCMASVCISGSIAPAPMPCRIRKAMSNSAFQALAHRTEPSRNRPRANNQSRLPPNRPWAQLTNGIVIARASR